MGLSWPLLPAASIIRGTARASYLSMFKKMCLPSTHNLPRFIHQAGKGPYLYSCDTSHAYCQLVLVPVEWPLVCFKVGDCYFTDVSLPFGRRWTAASRQSTTGLATTHLRQNGLKILINFDDIWWVAPSKEEATSHFTTVQATLRQLGLNDAKHKACPSEGLARLVVQHKRNDNHHPPTKLTEITALVADRQQHKHTNIHDIRALLGKLFFISQCCIQVHFFLNRMLDTLGSCPAAGDIALSTEFRMDLQWFACYIPITNSMYIMHKEMKVPMNACSTGAGTICGKDVYHAQFPSHILKEHHVICHLEALSAVAALHMWAPRHHGKCLH